MIDRILKYWYTLELLQPNWPVDEKKDIKISKDSPPWRGINNDSKIQIHYDVYIGKVNVGKLTDWLLDSLGHQKEEIIENNTSSACLCALKLTEEGMYHSGSFCISAFAWTVGKMAKDRNPDLSEESLKSYQKKWDEALTEKKSAFTIQDLEEVFAQICNEINFSQTNLFLCEKWAKEDVYKRKKDGNFPEINTSTELMNSFYTGEILRVIESPGDLVSNYGQALDGKKRERCEIDIDPLVMEKWLEAEMFPYGAWPSKYSPSLMQQLAINLSISDQKMIAVNGPPGTGKTTLLKEVVASNIVERALLLTEYSSPDSAFKKEKFSELNITYSVPDSKLTAFGILVASNNNAAVENISLELPKKIDEDRTGLFLNNDDFDDGYFSDAATELLEKPAWGLISAKLGKSTNVKEFSKKIWPKTGTGGLKKYFEKDYPKPNWDDACHNFNEAYKKVQEMRKEISYAQGLIPKSKSALKGIQDEERRLSPLLNQHFLIKESLLEKTESFSLLEKDCKGLAVNVDILHRNLPLSVKIFRPFLKKNKRLQDLQKLKDSQTNLILSMENTKAEIRKDETSLKSLDEQIRILNFNINKLRVIYENLQSELDKYNKLFGSNFVNESFWVNVENEKETQTSCPWTYDEYNKMREELFYQALMVHKAFVINSDEVKQNLMHLIKMWDGEFNTKDRQASFGSLINTLQFIIPVISTSFASVKSFLGNVGSGEMGVLVIDEAGQATPQSAVGAIWRAQKAIVVGDPLQVEPILNTPQVLINYFANKNQLPIEYHVSELSVQKFADAQSLYGGRREKEGEEMWLGCPLIVHRRCISPMFDISNEVAYNRRMILAAKEHDTRDFVFEKSCWFDIKGMARGNKDHSVEEQTDIVCKMIKKAIKIYNGFPSVYVIAPFKTVINPIKRKLRKVMIASLHNIDDKEKKIDKWLKDHCGTVHTFQGKEADEVILVLGCDEASGGGASKWVGQKPNIINVAVSRAKYRLAIVGDRSLWNRVNFVKDICKRNDIEIKLDFDEN